MEVGSPGKGSPGHHREFQKVVAWLVMIRSTRTSVLLIVASRGPIATWIAILIVGDIYMTVLP